MSALLTTSALTVRFGGVIAVNNVSLEIQPKRLYGLIGPNGSGKSTLLGAISRLTESTEGTMAFRQSDYTALTAFKVAHMGIARTFQTVRLLPSLSVIDNVMLGADFRHFGSSIFAPWLVPGWSTARERAVRDAAENAVARLGIEEYKEIKPDVLPYGIQRRVEIARALAGGPDLLLLDEPTAGMTKTERAEIGALLRRLCDEGLTQILVDHDVGLVVDVCDEVYVMNSGSILAQGVPAEVVQRADVQEAYLGKRHR
jgi:branched-chain amino acid transport system ATP-binding protein